MEASFQGQIARVEIPDLLTFVHLGRRTGVLELERNGQSTNIFLRQGDPVYAASNKEGLRLGDLLLRMGKITQKDMTRCVARGRDGDSQLGQVLLSEGLLGDDELSAYLKVQVSEAIFDAFGWDQGKFAFYDDVSPPPDTVTLQMDIQSLLMEGVRRIDERGRLAEVFPDLDAVMEAVSNHDHVRENVTLTPEEWQVFFLIDGRRSLREICQLAGNPDELGTLEVLNRLLGGNLIGFAWSRTRSPDAPDQGLAATMKHRVTDPATGAVRVGAPSGARDVGDAQVVVTRQAVPYTSQTVVLWARLVLQRDGSALSFPLSRETQTLGRSPKNDIVIADSRVSLFHARVDRTRDGFTLTDLNSTNGTLVNGKQIIGAAVLKPGDGIQFGPVELRYALD